MKALIVFLIFIGSTSLVRADDPETIVFSFQKQKNPDELAKATALVSEFLSKKIAKKVEVLVPTSYGASVQGLISNKVHIAYMDSLPFILASAETPLEVIAVEKRNGRFEYDSLIVVRKDSPIQSMNDLKGKRIVFSSPTSTSGYLFPLSRLIREKILAKKEDLNKHFLQVSYAGGYDKAILSVAQGQADAASFSDYAFEGPKADLYGTADNRHKLRVLARTPGVPTHLIAASKKLSPELIVKIQAALLALAQEKPELLSSVYGAAQLSKPGASHVSSTNLALQLTGLEVKSFIK